MINTKKLQDLLISDLRLLKQPDGWLTAGRPRREGGKLLDPNLWQDDQEPTFDWLFGRDSIITALMLLPFGNGPEIVKATLRALAHVQGKTHNRKSEEQPGKIPHEVRGTQLLRSESPDWEFPYYGAIDATSLFIVLASEYVQQTEDWDFIKEIWDNLVAAADWMKYWGDIDGDYFIENSPLNRYGIRNQVWKDFSPYAPTDKFSYPNAAIVEIQGYTYLAWTRMKWMAASQELPSWKEYWGNARVLQLNFESYFWMEKEGFYALALDEEKKQIKTITSNQGHLLFSGILSREDRREAVVKRLLKHDMWTPYGIRTMSSKEKGFNPYWYHQGSIWFHDNWMIWWGLNRYAKFRKEADELRANLVKTARMLGEAPELHAYDHGILKTTDHVTGRGYKPANHVQAWSGSAILNLLTHEMDPEERKEIVI